MAFLLRQRDDILTFAEGKAEKVGKIRYHLGGLGVFACLDRPDDGVHGIVEEMGVDLGLQQRQFHPAQGGLLLGGLLHQGVQAARHILKAFAQGAQLKNVRGYRLMLGQVAVADLLHTGAQPGNGFGDGPPDAQGAAHQHPDDGRGGQGQQHQLSHQPDLHIPLQGVELYGLIVQVVVHVLLDQAGDDVDVVFQLGLAFVVGFGVPDLVDLFLQIFAQVQHTADGQPAFPLGGGVQQFPGQLLGGLHLGQGQPVGILAADDVVIHLLVDGGFEILVEFRGGGHIVQQL